MATGLIASTGVLSTATPTLISDLWLPHAIPMHDWAKALKLSSRFETTVDESQEGDEQRVGLRIRPTRTQTMRATAFDRADVEHLKNLQRRGSTARSLMPLHSDQVPLTGNPSGNTYNCDTFDRRLFAGGFVIVVKDDGALVATDFLVAIIVSLTTTQITLDRNLGSVLKKGILFPGMEVEMELKERGKSITDRVETIEITSTESAGQTVLPLSTNLNSFDNTRFSTGFNGLPIFDREPDWKTVRTGQHRIANRKKLGTGVIFDVSGDRTRETFEMSYIAGPSNNETGRRRRDAMDFVRFFESRAGKLFPFWLFSPLDQINLRTIDMTFNKILVETTLDIADWDQYKFIGLQEKGKEFGGSHMHSIQSIQDFGGGFHEITLGESTVVIRGIGLEGFERVTTAHLVRFDSDELKENWVTDETMITRGSTTVPCPSPASRSRVRLTDPSGCLT